MKKITRLAFMLALLLIGAVSANAATEKVHATFENPSNTNTTWDAATKTFTWSTTYYNQLRNIGLPSGDLSQYKKLVVDCTIVSGEQFRILFYKGGSNLTLYAKDGVNEFDLIEELKAVAPDDYNEYLLACDEICLSGNNAAAPGEAIINDVYLETYDDEGEKVYATFENPSNTNTTWDATTKTFTWSTTYYNQLRNIGLPSGDLSNYKKLVVDCSIVSGEQFRILFYKGGSNLTLYAKDGVNEFDLVESLKAVAPDDYNEYLLACDEICLSGNNAVAPGEAVINSVYLETYGGGGAPYIPPVVVEEDPGKPAGDYIDLTEAFPDLTPKLATKMGNGEVVLGARSQNVVANLSAYSSLTVVGTPGLKLVFYLNHEIEAQQNAGDYTEEDAGKYVFLDAQIGEDGLYTLDLTEYAKQDLNCIALPWDNSNKGTVWYLLLTESTDPLVALKNQLQKTIDLAKLQSPVAKTEDSFGALESAISTAEQIIADASATESAITNAQSNLQSAIDNLELAEGYVELTADMFMSHETLGGEGTPAGCAYVVGESTSQPYGDGSVFWLNYADLSGYDKLILTVTEGTPRIMLNREEPLPEGSEGYDQNGSTYIQITDEPVEGVVEVDLTAYDAPRLNAIKGANWANVTVTGMYLLQGEAGIKVKVGPAGYATYVCNEDVEFQDVEAYAAKYENGKVKLIALTEAPAGTPVIIKADEGTYTLQETVWALTVEENDLLVSDGTAESDGTIFVLADGTQGVGFYRLDNNVKVPNGKAYLEIAASGRDFIGLGDATAIVAVKGAQTTGAVYNLGGQRVEKAVKGVYIIDGKKVVK